MKYNLSIFQGHRWTCFCGHIVDRNQSTGDPFPTPHLTWSPQTSSQVSARDQTRAEVVRRQSVNHWASKTACLDHLNEQHKNWVYTFCQLPCSFLQHVTEPNACVCSCYFHSSCSILSLNHSKQWSLMCCK